MREWSTITLFQNDRIRAVELTLADAPAVQAFFDRNPDYGVLANGQPPGPNEAAEELNSTPPADWQFGRQYLIGFVDSTSSLVAFATLISDQWLRLGVIKGNTRAERFWERLGFIDVRERHDVVMGTLSHTIRVMVKPLTTAPLTDYLRLVARDRPESDQ